MDWVETVPLIAFAVWALVSRWMRSRKRSQASPGGQPTDAGGPSVGQTLRNLLREIQQGMGELVEASAEPEPIRRPRPVPEPESDSEAPPSPPVLVASKPRRRRRRSALAQGLLDDLGSGPRSLARAMLLLEVLGPPVALRDPRSGWRQG